MKNIIKIKKRGDDGYKIISIRIKENILKKIDHISAESNHSRNELINILLENSIDNIEIEE
ncbi:ribbon-helix-helix protein, CopG family [Ructibacterium gallinarum]|uniref:Ribbon-helix-helix protein, CopG family n=1 Tax=Ructibacterium gallinarum TaxID=2779355 RepID=A0A9D5M2G4_9FIRM|nr:ribbon-helix-helix protein, CopG family [Ructibacterium gallinarum]MBE5041085.1 ribbon-helix-helix protein, CopG family [Ructibacterium gallinarum]